MEISTTAEQQQRQQQQQQQQQQKQQQQAQAIVDMNDTPLTMDMGIEPFGEEEETHEEEQQQDESEEQCDEQDEPEQDGPQQLKPVEPGAVAVGIVTTRHRQQPQTKKSRASSRLLESTTMKRSDRTRQEPHRLPQSPPRTASASRSPSPFPSKSATAMLSSKSPSPSPTAASFQNVLGLVAGLHTKGSRRGVSRSAIKLRLTTASPARVNLALKKLTTAGKLLKIGDSFKLTPEFKLELAKLHRKKAAKINKAIKSTSPMPKKRSTHKPSKQTTTTTTTTPTRKTPTTPTSPPPHVQIQIHEDTEEMETEMEPDSSDSTNTTDTPPTPSPSTPTPSKTTSIPSRRFSTRIHLIERQSRVRHSPSRYTTSALVDHIARQQTQPHKRSKSRSFSRSPSPFSAPKITKSTPATSASSPTSSSSSSTTKITMTTAGTPLLRRSQRFFTPTLSIPIRA